MDVEQALIMGRDKYMWDGAVYETEEEAKKKGAEYEADNFQVHYLEQEGKHLVYTRRVVTEIVLEGEPPA
jgi:pyruvoyl-dependent arginine decarboxylase (PvlArgDC)